MIPISVKAIMQGPRGILFVKNPRDELELPGGRPETHECLEKALAREVKEECGLDIITTRYLGSKSYEIIPDKYVLLVFFRCEFIDQELTLSEEHMGYEWVNITAQRPSILPVFYWDVCHAMNTPT